MSREAMKLALEALEEITDEVFSPYDNKLGKAITALREALAEQPAQQDSTCSNALRAQGKAYPRTCKKCGLGPCVELAQQALDKKAENARELGLDYEPARDSGIVTAGGADPRTQRTWVGLEKGDMPTDPDPMYDHKYFTAGMVYAANKLMEKNT
jgi:hypothetical protein